MGVSVIVTIPCFGTFSGGGAGENGGPFVRALAMASRHTGINQQQILSHRRYRELCEARYAVMRAMRLRGHSMPRIGRMFGRGDHATVLSGLRRAAELYATDKDFAALCDRVAAA